MGEVAEMMLDGTLCAGCGVAMDDICDGFEAPGYPRYCSKACEPEDHKQFFLDPIPLPPKVKCELCGRKVAPSGLKNHKRDKHGVKP